jgi:hypothetical protein
MTKCEAARVTPATATHARGPVHGCLRNGISASPPETRDRGQMRWSGILSLGQDGTGAETN